jgi:hypothetical protein
VGAKGGGSGRAASSRTATDSNPPSGGRRGGVPSPQLNDSLQLPSPGCTKTRQPNGRQSEAPQELVPDAAMNPSRREIEALLRRRRCVSGSISTQPGGEKASRELARRVREARGRRRDRDGDGKRKPSPTETWAAFFRRRFWARGPSRLSINWARNI